MPKARKTAREKLETVLEAEITVTPKGRMLIPRPLDVDAMMRRIQRGRLATINQIRDKLAKDFHADYTCPLTAGIFVRIAAEAAEEDLRNGLEEITPYWRVIRRDGDLNEKLPGGVEAQAARLVEEGHTVERQKGRKLPVVRDFEKSLQEL